MQPVRLNTDPISLSNGDVSTTAAMSCRLVWQNVIVPWTWNDWRGSGRGLFNVTTVTFNKWLWRLLYLCTYRHHLRHPSHWRPCGLLRSPVISSEVPNGTIFLWGYGEASVLLVPRVPFGLYAAASFFCIAVGILLWVLFSVFLLWVHFFCGPGDWQPAVCLSRISFKLTWGAVPSCLQKVQASLLYLNTRNIANTYACVSYTQADIEKGTYAV